jgi:hypothetical protein
MAKISLPALDPDKVAAASGTNYPDLLKPAYRYEPQ